MLKHAERIKWLRRYREFKNRPAQIRRERWMNRFLYRQYN